MQLRLQKQEAKTRKLRGVLAGGLEALGIETAQPAAPGSAEEAEDADPVVCVDQFRVEDLARLVVDIAVSLNADAGGEEDEGGHGEAGEDAQGSRQLQLQRENGALQLQLAQANREVARLRRELQDAAPPPARGADGGGPATGAPEDAGPGAAGRGRLDELYEREESLSMQLAELRHRLSGSQHDAVAEMRRRQKLEADFEAEWSRRQRLERKMLSLRRRYDAARGQFVKETELREQQLWRLGTVRRARPPRRRWIGVRGRPPLTFARAVPCVPDPTRPQHVAAMRERLADLGVDVGEFPRPAVLEEDAGPVIGAGTGMKKALAGAKDDAEARRRAKKERKRERRLRRAEDESRGGG